MKFSSSLPLLAASMPAALGLGQNATVTLTAGQGLLQLAGGGTNGQILVSANDWWGVLRAAEDLAGDVGKVVGRNLTLGNWMAAGPGKRDLLPSDALKGRDVPSGPQGGSPGEGGTGFPAGAQSGGWGWGANGGSGAHPPPSPGHNVTSTQSSGTTVYYEFNPVTSFVNYTVGPTRNFTGPTLINNSKAQPVIIAGTIGKSDVITELISSAKIDVSAIEGQWESFISEVVTDPLPGVSKALVIAGADLRGTIFGLYDVSEQIGVSPWWWFADVVVRKASGIWALGVKKVQGPPSIKYRGLFINDEQPGLANWIAVNYQPGKYGLGYNHYFYSNVFELLLRLRANYFWPAMWASMFNVDDVENQPLADAYGVVMGTSHTEPMMRATNEWTTFGTEYGGNGQWEYDTNNASLIPFFKYGAQRTKPYGANSLFTMAMRGSGDTAIDLTVPEAITVLNNVLAEQRSLLEEVFEGTNITDIPQMWCLYKEVQGYYETGMSVPDDITLLWSDDNYGNTRRLPLFNETSRSGGSGVYYHFDYVGSPRNYKWINTIQLEKTVEQMQLTYARQADRIWIVNVGDLKPLEIPINHFFDMAYNTPQWGYDSVPTWLNLWATREFDSAVANDLSSVVDRYGMYANRRKYELIDPTIYSVINYNEADAVLAQWATLASDAQAIYNKLDAAMQPSFYEMVLQPVLGGQVVNQIYIAAAKNLHNSVQKRNSANAIAQNVLDLFNEDHVLTQRYHDLLGGKWNHMLDQTHLGYEINYWQQPMRNLLPPLSYVQLLETSLAGNIGIGVEASNATVSGDDSFHANSGDTLVLPPMDPYGPKTRWIDVFARGTAGCHWSLNISEPYVIAKPSSGSTGGNGSDTRVYVSIDWAKAPPAPNSTTVNIDVISSCDNNTWGNYPAPTMQVPVNNTEIPSSFTGFVESDMHLAIEAEHTSFTNEVDGVSYIVLPGHGRTLSGVTMMPVLADSQPAGTGPVLEYDVYTFTNTSKANVTLFLSPSLNQNGGGFGQYRPLKYAIAFDDEEPQTIQFVANVTSELDMPTGWNGAVSDGVWGVSSGNMTTTTHDLTVAGVHTLKIWAVEPAVIFQKIVVDLGGVRPSYLGPPESFRAGTDSVDTYEGLNALGVQTSSAI